MKTKYIILLFGILFVACKKSNSLQEYMVDNWETSYLKIEMPTYQKSDSLYIFEDHFTKSNSGRAQSTYNNDGTFSSWFKQPNGEKVGKTFGKWIIKGDSLFIDFFYQGRQVKTSYSIKKTKEGFEGKSLYDWDKDGEFDDILLMKTKKIKL